MILEGLGVSFKQHVQEGRDFGLKEQGFALIQDGSCCLVGDRRAHDADKPVAAVDSIGVQLEVCSSQIFRSQLKQTSKHLLLRFLHFVVRGNLGQLEEDQALVDLYPQLFLHNFQQSVLALLIQDLEEPFEDGPDASYHTHLDDLFGVVLLHLLNYHTKDQLVLVKPNQFLSVDLFNSPQS